MKIKIDFAIATYECLNPIPLGAENGVLPDSSFTATSFATSREPFKARLRGQFGKYYFTFIINNFNYLRFFTNL